MELTGNDIINALIGLNGKANIAEIVAQLSSNNKGGETSLLEATKILIEAGVRFGCIVQEESNYLCGHTIKETNRDGNEDANKEPVKKTTSNNGITANSRNEQKSTIYPEHTVSTDDDDTNEEANNYMDCYRPSFRRERLRSRSKHRKGKRVSSRRGRIHK